MKSKTANQKLQQKSPLFFSLGLVIALSVVITAFEWKTEEIIPKIDFDDPTSNPFDADEVIATKHKVPPRPKPATIEETIGNEPESITDALDLLNPDEFDEPTGDFGLDDLPPLEEEDAPEFKDYSVIAPSFVGGQDKFYEYLRENLEYPSRAKAMGLGGAVHLSFVIDENGLVSDVEVLKGINEEMDNAAIKVLENSPRWNPGSKGGIPTQARMKIPIVFSFESN